MQVPIRFDFPCRTNADYQEQLRVTQNGVPIDLSGYDVSMTAKYNTDGVSIFDISTVTSSIEGFYITEPDEGIMEVRIDKETLSAAYGAAVQNIDDGSVLNLKHDIKFIDPDSNESVWFQGLIRIEKGITL